MRNQIHKTQFEEKKAMDDRKMMALRKRGPISKFATGFQQRVSNRRHALASNVQEMQALRNEDVNMVTSEDVDTLPPVEEINLNRTTRAYRSRLTGVGSSIDREVLEEKNHENDMRKMESTDSLQYTIDTMQRAEKHKRLAQDQLLLSQLDVGVLPEQFIKAGVDALSVTVMLSKHSIGDVRGKCLGKW
jgi:hypothetical protein